MAATGRFSMKNWTIQDKKPVTLAEAFGINKGTFSFPKLSPILARPAAAAQQAVTNPAGGRNSKPPTAKQARAYYNIAAKMAQQKYGWGPNQMAALNNIVMAESGWNPTVVNSSSGAYGIPQALPGSKMAAAGPNWRTDPTTQIKWMLEYIRSTYGNPENAWAFHKANGWY